MNQRSVFGFGRNTKNEAAWDAATQRFDVATRIEIGARPYQQDALLENFPTGDDYGIAVLADGMGGHLGGHLASAMALGAAFSTIKTSLVQPGNRPGRLSSILRKAIDGANKAISEGVAEQPEFRGMGSTMVACLTFGNRLYWASVGDSPLWLYRDGILKRLNEDHSMGPRIDAMVASGMITKEVGADHPQRSQLTSALCGDMIESVDCPSEPTSLEVGDIVILASDGLQTLSDAEIADLLKGKRRRTAAEISQGLIQAVASRAHIEQDNTSLMVLKVLADVPVKTVSDNTNGTKNVDQLDEDDGGLERASDLLNEALRL